MVTGGTIKGAEAPRAAQRTAFWRSAGPGQTSLTYFKIPRV